MKNSVLGLVMLSSVSTMASPQEIIPKNQNFKLVLDEGIDYSKKVYFQGEFATTDKKKLADGVDTCSLVVKERNINKTAGKPVEVEYYENPTKYGIPYVLEVSTFSRSYELKATFRAIQWDVYFVTKSIKLATVYCKTSRYPATKEDFFDLTSKFIKKIESDHQVQPIDSTPHQVQNKDGLVVINGKKQWIITPPVDEQQNQPVDNTPQQEQPKN